MDTAHRRNTIVFYIMLAFAFCLCFGAIYQNLYVEKNFRQFTIDDIEPTVTDLYMHSNQMYQ